MVHAGSAVQSGGGGKPVAPVACWGATVMACVRSAIGACGSEDVQPVIARHRRPGTSRFFMSGLGLQGDLSEPVEACKVHSRRISVIPQEISAGNRWRLLMAVAVATGRPTMTKGERDRKSTRLNSSHVKTSYAVFCLKKKKKH